MVGTSGPTEEQPERDSNSGIPEMLRGSLPDASLWRIWQSRGTGKEAQEVRGPPLDKVLTQEAGLMKSSWSEAATKK